MARPKPDMLVLVLPFLHKLKKYGRTIITANDLIEAGMAVEGGWAEAEDDYEGPAIWLTKSGERVVR